MLTSQLRTPAFIENIIFEAVTGSRAYGLQRENSDTDLRGWFMPPFVTTVGFWDATEQIVKPEESDSTYWRVDKYIKLVVNNNPNVLETLWCKQYTIVDNPFRPFVEELIANRSRFLHQGLAKTYGGYATAQMKKSEMHIRTGKSVEGHKNMMHMCRLMIDGAHALRTGNLLVNMGEWREKLLQIKRGEMLMQDILDWYLELDADFKKAKDETTLPDNERQAEQYADDFLIRIHLKNIEMYQESQKSL